MKIPAEDLRLILALLNDDFTVEQIADKWDVTTGAMNYFLSTCNVDVSALKFNRRAKLLLEHIHESNFELTIITGISRDTIKALKTKMREMEMIE